MFVASKIDLVKTPSPYMYLEYFGLTEKPFQITPDPRFLYMSRRHHDGFAHLLYGADEAGGFVLLTGEVGTGKTTLYRSALESITDNVRVALILNPKQSPLELIASICAGPHVDNGVDCQHCVDCE